MKKELLKIIKGKENYLERLENMLEELKNSNFVEGWEGRDYIKSLTTINDLKKDYQRRIENVKDEIDILKYFYEN